MTVSTLLPILCIPLRITTTSCSKGPQGLRFPLGVRGIFATQYFRKVSIRDSDDLVKPFMQVVIRTTRYYATLSILLLPLKLMATEHFCSILYVSIKIGLYHHDCVWRIVSEDSKDFITFQIYFLFSPPFIVKTFLNNFLNSSLSACLCCSNVQQLLQIFQNLYFLL